MYFYQPPYDDTQPKRPPFLYSAGFHPEITLFTHKSDLAPVFSDKTTSHGGIILRLTHDVLAWLTLSNRRPHFHQLTRRDRWDLDKLPSEQERALASLQGSPAPLDLSPVTFTPRCPDNVLITLAQGITCDQFDDRYNSNSLQEIQISFAITKTSEYYLRVDFVSYIG
ncbi:hypothetical protein CSKR_200916 [Clonorchis sinensis]|uniref:Uncharacterized protein n=1 Tax=Clonorchis sinensis TaxID=79923 RepID=A0A8T1MJJ2_CLOSI|nr:hypothetical protein CSKR_200916 [Clonorchis sinensis]